MKANQAKVKANVIEVIELLDRDGDDDLVIKLLKPNQNKSVHFIEIETLKNHRRELAYSCDSLQKAKALFEAQAIGHA